MKTLYTVFLLIWAACASPKNQGDFTLQKILTFQDNRTSVDSLYRFLRFSDANVVSRTIMALGQMQDTLAIDTLFRFAFGSDTIHTAKSVFALGQIGYASGSEACRKNIETKLIGLFDLSMNLNVKAKILEALGKTGSAESFELLEKTLHDSTDGIVRESAFACARLAIRDIRSSKVHHGLLNNLDHSNADVRWACTYAIMRIHDKSMGPKLLAHLKDPDEKVRMDAARALGLMDWKEKDSDLKEVVQALVVAAFNDADWRVRVNAVNALSNFKFDQDNLKKIYFLIAFEGKKDPDFHVRISAIRAMSKSFKQDVSEASGFLKEFSQRFLPNAEPQEKGEIVIALCQMFGQRILQEPSMAEYITRSLSDPNGYLRSRMAEALGYTNDPKAIPILETALRDSFGLVKNNALEALSKIKVPAAQERIIGAVETSDITLLSIAAGILASDEKIKKDTIISEKLTNRIIASFQNIKEPRDVEAQTAIFEALGGLRRPAAIVFLKSFLNDSDHVVAESAAKNIAAITGEKIALSKTAALNLRPIDYDFYLKLISKKPVAVIETNKGRVEMEFYTDEAPLTVMNFVRLAERKFFDGLHFHRVVPNFVIQGGDPLGTGWGGPGYSIRSEFSSLRYDRGVVGMASAGRDTEGCQWFITHSPQPHLDGRYTIFGRVRKGMDVVDRIQVGDIISQVKIFWR